MVLGYKDITLSTHGQIIETLMDECKRKLICVPRGCFKSSLGVVSYCIYRILNDPNIRILIDSELYTNSKNLLREIKLHLESQALTDLFGEFKTDHTWNESEITIQQRTKNLKEATITSGGMGTTKVGQHYDLIIFDDMNSDNNSQTQEGREKVIQHYRMATSILEPHGTIVVIGTRYAQNDLIGFILDNEIGVKDVEGL